MERIRDKEAPVRVQAVLAMSKLWAADDESESPTILDVLLDTLSHDTSSYVFLCHSFLQRRTQIV